MAGINFDATQVAPNRGFSAVPKGKYPVYISKSEFKPTSNGSGKLLELHHTINGGSNHGQDIMISINWENPSQKAVEIGHGQFSAICHAVGVLHVQDTQQLHNILFELEVDVTSDGKYNNYIGANPIAQPVQQAPVMQPQFQPAPQQVTPVYQQPQQPANIFTQQPQQIAPTGQSNPMAAYEQMAQQPVQQAPVSQPQQPQGQAPAVPDWILNQQRAQAAAQGQPTGNA
jgi:hypothetical protein